MYILNAFLLVIFLFVQKETPLGQYTVLLELEKTNILLGADNDVLFFTKMREVVQHNIEISEN